MVKIIEMFIPKSNKKTRPGRKMTPTSITDHETDNTNVRANARAHALLQYNGNGRQASWHFQTDDEPEIYQSIPVNEVAFHAGNATGNSTSIANERCVNKDGDYLKTLENTIVLYRMLIKTYPTIKEIVQHNKWSGKHCPRKMREGYKGVNWSKFIARVKSEVDVAKPIKPVKPDYITTNNTVKIGQKVTIKNSASNYATGQKIPNKYKGKSFTVQQRGSNRVLLKELYSWVKISDLTNTSTSTPSKPNSTQNASKKGNQTTDSIVTYLNSIKVDSSYANRKKMAIKQGIKNYTGTAAQNTRLLKILRGGSTAPEKTNKPKTLKVGSKVKIKSSAQKYSRVNVSIPTSRKNKTMTVQQMGKDDVLLKEVYSWVKKSDVQ